MRFLLIFLLLCGVCYADELQDISDGLVGSSDFEQTITILMNHVHERMKPNVIPLEEARKLTDREKYYKGVGWCNHQVNVWMELCQRQGIRTRMLYLLSEDQATSPHTIGEAWDGRKWITVDVSNNLIFKKKNGTLMSRQDMANDWELCLEKLTLINPDSKYWEMFLRNCYQVKIKEP